MPAGAASGLVSLAFLIIRGVRTVQNALLREHRMDVADNYAARRIYTQVSIIRKLITALVLILGISSILMMFDAVRQLGTSILASVGIAGIILGFAAQKNVRQPARRHPDRARPADPDRRRRDHGRRVRPDRRHHAHLPHGADGRGICAR